MYSARILHFKVTSNLGCMIIHDSRFLHMQSLSTWHGPARFRITKHNLCLPTSMWRNYVAMHVLDLHMISRYLKHLASHASNFPSFLRIPCLSLGLHLAYLSNVKHSEACTNPTTISCLPSSPRGTHPILRRKLNADCAYLFCFGCIKIRREHERVMSIASRYHCGTHAQ